MRYFVGVLVVFGLLLIIILLLLGGGKSTNTNIVNLDSLAGTDSSVRLVTVGALVYNDDHRSISINVSRDTVDLDILKGYEDEVISSRSFANNQTAYATFLRALDLAKFNQGDAKKLSDPRGHCPFGQQNFYEVIGGAGQVNQKFWDDSCGVGNFDGMSSVIIRLFQNQVPNYSELTQNVNLSA
jgi:hypothetical protein